MTELWQDHLLILSVGIIFWKAMSTGQTRQEILRDRRWLISCYGHAFRISEHHTSDTLDPLYPDGGYPAAKTSTRQTFLPRSPTEVCQDKALPRSALKTSYPIEAFPSTSRVQANHRTRRDPASIKQRYYSNTSSEDADRSSASFTRRMEFSNGASSLPTSHPKRSDGITMLESNGLRDKRNSREELGVRVSLAKGQIKSTSSFSLKTPLQSTHPNIARTQNHLPRNPFHPRIAVYTKNGRSIQIGISIGLGGAQMAYHSPPSFGWLQRIFGIGQLRRNGLPPLQTVRPVRRTTAYYRAIYSTNYL